MTQSEITLAAQSTHFKLKKSASKDYGIFIDSVTFDKIKPYIFTDDKGRDAIELVIHKNDCIKALGNIMCSLPLFTSVAGVAKEITNVVEVYSDLSNQISNFFGNSEKAVLSSLYFTELQGRNYLWGTEGKRAVFELRKFFIANHTNLHFSFSDDEGIDLRFDTHVVSEHLEQFEFEEIDEPKLVGSPSLPLQLIYYGAPGTGKSFTIDNHTTDKNSIRTTFHPDTDYASFVGAYKPTMEDVEISYTSEGKVKYAMPIESDDKRKHPGTERKIVYKYVPQAFLKAYVEAWKRYGQEDSEYYLVIEEINRGNCAQIFGDLFQLLDRNNQDSSSYAIAADEDIARFLREDKNGFALTTDGGESGLTQEQRDTIEGFILQKDNGKSENIGADILSGKKLLLPPNLHIWATMNTSDQSLFPIDSAFKRRWNWRYVPIVLEPNKPHSEETIQWQFEVGGNRYMWADFLRKMNPLIYELTESADKQMGYFFAKADSKTSGEEKENNLISEDVFLNKVLFYVWTDVLKDFDAGKEPFIDSDTKKAYLFSDFFDSKLGKKKLSEFIGKKELGLTPMNAPKNNTGAVTESDPTTNSDTEDNPE